MAYAQVLSQQEVDSLLTDLGGDDHKRSPAPAETSEGIPRYDLGSPDRVVRGRMHGLELINERFARSLRAGFLSFLRRSADINVKPLQVLHYGDYVHNLPVPANINVLEFKPLRGMGVLVFDPKLVFLVVDNLFGSDGRFAMRVEGREFSPAEMRIIERLRDMVLKCYAEAWAPIKPLEFNYVRAEMHGRLANIAAPNEVVVNTTLEVEIGPVGGFVHVCLPYSMLEPVRDLLANPIRANQVEVDQRWVNQLTGRMRHAQVDVSVDFARIDSSIGDLLHLRPGDVLPIELPATVTASVERTPVLECTYGVSNGRYALRVERTLHPELEPQNDE
jgi:flagellar motor switch protein FliM